MDTFLHPIFYVPVLAACGVVAIVLKAIIDSHRAGLSQIPGPVIARYTDAWRLFWCYKYFGRADNFSTCLNRTYGDVVRIGPKIVAVFDPAAIQTIYGSGSRLDKGDGYRAFAAPGVTTGLLSIKDEETHSKYRRPVASAYSLSSLKHYEPYVDRVLNELVDALYKKAHTSEVINIGQWCQYYAYDVVAMLTFGQTLGFLETGTDVHDMVKVQKGATFYAATFSQMPWLDRLMKRTSMLHKLGSVRFRLFVQGRVGERLREKTQPGTQPNQPDLLAHFINAQSKYPDLMTDRQIVILAAGNLFAGSQSPSAVFDRIFRALACTPSIQERLHAELVEANCTYPVTFDQTQHLPYLDAVVREGYRLHGIGFFVLERLTPHDGLKLPSGQYLPAGIKVGGPSHGLSLRKQVFGEDADEFKPERWLRRHDGETDKAFAQRRSAMERCDLTFGHGTRGCIGKSLANMEIYKAMATLVGLFQFEVKGTPKPFETNVILHPRKV